MIGRLRGVVDGIEESRCLIDVNGVGYVVFASSRTLAALPAPPTAVSLLIETQVREDAIALFGFGASAERDWFRLLTSVQGVGGRLALAILSALAPEQLVAALGAADKAMLTRAPGVGAKLAARLVTELRERAGALPGSMPDAAAPAVAADALSALVNLGYRRPEAEAALTRALAELGEGAGLDVLIRAGLRSLSR